MTQSIFEVDGITYDPSHVELTHYIFSIKDDVERTADMASWPIPTGWNDLGEEQE